jgi:hypothetical protein
MTLVAGLVCSAGRAAIRYLFGLHKPRERGIYDQATALLLMGASS